MKLFGCRSKKGVVLLGENKTEILGADETSVFGQSGQEEVYGEQEKKRFTLEHVVSGQSNYVSDIMLLGDEAEQKPGTYSHLDEMLFYLFDLSTFDIDKIQIAFLDKQGTKALYAPEVNLKSIPKDYAVKGQLNERLHEINSGFYHSIISCLQELKQGKKKLESGAYSHKFLKKGKVKKLKAKQRQLRDLVLRYMDYSHGLIERHTIHSYLGRQSKPRRQFSLQEKLDHELLPRDRKSLIIHLKQNRYSRDSEHYLKKTLGCQVHLLKNFPALTVRGSPKEMSRIHNLLMTKKYNKFGSASKILSRIKTVQYSHGVYIPELIGDFRKKKVVYRFLEENVLWNLKNIGADIAQETTMGGGATVGIIDTGVDYKHSNLSQCFGEKLGYDFVRDKPDPMDFAGHGTHVAGIVAGKTTGVAPETTLYAVRVLDSNGSGFLADILLGVDWCVSNKVDIANLSLGAPASSDIEEEIYNEAYKLGLTCVAAAGNEGYGASYPAAYDSVIAVAAVDRFNEHAEFSNIWYTNNVSAPGVGVFSSVPNNDFDVFSGTSMASPHVAGSGALLRSLGAINKDSFLRAIEDTAMKLGDDDDENYMVFGCGLIQAQNLVGEQKWKMTA